MAHFAGIDAGNIVRAVNRIHDNDAPTEEAGVAFCRSLWGDELRWLQTSYNGKTRGNYAGVGDYYDDVLDVFLKQKPFPSWQLDAEFHWVPPVPYPQDFDHANINYSWNEGEQKWEARS